MKITKSELKEMIREALREELKTNRYALTESSNEAAETLTYIEKLWAKKAKEQDDTFDDVFGSDETKDYEKMLQLARTILKHPSFKFTSRDNINKAAEFITQRSLIMAIEEANGDKQAFLNWAKSKLSADEQEMFRNILK